MISDHNRDTSPDHPTTPNHTKSQHNTKIKLGYVALPLDPSVVPTTRPPAETENPLHKTGLLTPVDRSSGHHRDIPHSRFAPAPARHCAGILCADRSGRELLRTCFSDARIAPLNDHNQPLATRAHAYDIM